MYLGEAAAKERVLRWALIGFMVLGAIVIGVLPPLVLGGYTWRDPAILVALIGYPVMVWILWYLVPRDTHRAARAFVATVFAMSWVFGVAIQGTAYQAGNYAFLVVTVMFAAFFLDVRATAAYAAANVVGVLVIEMVWGLPMVDLALSLSYLFIFSTMLVLLAGVMQDNARELASQSATLEENEKQLRFALREQAAVLDSTDDAMVHLEADGRIKTMNRRAAEMARALWGHAPNEGENALMLVPLQARDAARAWLATAGPRPDVRRLPFEGRHFDIRLTRTPDGSMLAVATDVTAQAAQQEAEAERREREARLESLQLVNRLQRDFMRVATNELHVPLTPVRLQLHILRDRTTGTLNEAQMRSLDVVERNVMRLSGLVNQIGDVQRIEDNKLHVDIGDVEIVQLTQAEVEAMAAFAQMKDIQVEYRGEPSLWVRGDAEKLRVVVHQLLDNALKFTPSGGTITIRIHDGTTFRWEISDDGIGFDEEGRERLFQAFTQLHEAGLYAGTGLGLALCKGYVEAQGGTIHGASDGPGSGATFSFTLPLAARVELPA